MKQLERGNGDCLIDEMGTAYRVHDNLGSNNARVETRLVNGGVLIWDAWPTKRSTSDTI